MPAAETMHAGARHRAWLRLVVSLAAIATVFAKDRVCISSDTEDSDGSCWDFSAPSLLQAKRGAVHKHTNCHPWPIFVRTVTNNTITLHVANHYRTEHLKEQIEEKEGIPRGQQHLIHNGQLMREGRMIALYGVHNQSTLHLVLRPKACANPEMADVPVGAECARLPNTTRAGAEISGAQEEFNLAPVPDSAWWEVSLPGSAAELCFPPRYPAAPPKARFKKPLPNHSMITRQGGVCIDLLQDAWSPALTTVDVIRAILTLTGDTEH